MIRTVVLFAILAIFGCDENGRLKTPPPPPPPPKPEIRVTISDSTNKNLVITVKYVHHDISDRDITATLDNPQDLALYKKEVNFLLSQIEEVEKRMLAKEQVAESPTIPPKVQTK